MQKVQQQGHLLIHRGSSASSWKSLSPSSSGSDAATFSDVGASLGQQYELHLLKQETDVSAGGSCNGGLRRNHSSLTLLSTKSSSSFRRASQNSMSSTEDTIASTSPSGDEKAAAAPLFLKFLVAFVTVFKIDRLLEKAVSVLEILVRRYPKMLRFEFVRELVPKQKIHGDEHQQKITNKSSSMSSNKSSGSLTFRSSYSSDISKAFEQSKQDEQILSPARILRKTSTENSDEIWGHFADFQEHHQLDQSCFQGDVLGDPRHALIRKQRGSAASFISARSLHHLCTLVETEEDDE